MGPELDVPIGPGGAEINPGDHPMGNRGFPYFFEGEGLVKLSAISPRAIVGWELLPQRNVRLKSFPIVLTVEDPAKIHSAA